MGTDVLSTTLAIINCLMIINIGSTFSYDYDKASRYKYLRHISRLIRKSILDYINFFYVKIYFRIFKWRYIHQIEDVVKERNNIFNLFVLLNLLFWQTNLDIVVGLIFGGPCLIHWKRKVFY